tara:strand:+ start:152 stop:625 length:474 start_codon:yes stop_codon:yes gene_type:complete
MTTNNRRAMQYATQRDFLKAPVGHPFLACCATCGQETGEIILKSKGRANTGVSTWSIPKYIVPSEDSTCEFCEALGTWMGSEEIDPKETGLQYGMAKIVTENEDTSRELVAFVPFSSEERRVNVGDEDIELAHRMVIKAVQAGGDQMKLVSILEEGV